MKRNILAIAIPALLIAGAANAAEVYNKDGNKVDIYGRVYALNYLNVGDKANQGDGDKTTARIGFRGETQISHDLVGYGRFEYERGPGSNTSDETRYAFAGFKFDDWGSIDYGRNDGVLKMATSYTDVLPEFGGEFGGTDRYLSGRADGLLTYRNSGFFGLVDGLNFALQYQDRSTTAGSGSNSDNGDGWGTGLEYNLDGFGVAAAYSNSIPGSADKGSATLPGGKRAEMASFAAKYDANNLYVAAMYGVGHNVSYTSPGATDSATRDKVENWEVVAQYGINFANGAKLTPSIAYLQGKDKTKGVKGKDADIVKYYEIGATYDFNKNMTAVVDYKLNRIKDADDTLALGLIYRF